MFHLRELYRLKDQVRFELNQVSKPATPYPKRHKADLATKNDKKFESTLVRIKGKWNQAIDKVFRTIEDTGAYDKLAYDLIITFHNFHSKYQFDGDQLSCAFRCLIIPITGQILDETELGKRAFDRQKRRTYLLNKILSHGKQEVKTKRPRQETPSLDGSVDVCSESPRSFGIDRVLSQMETNYQTTVNLKPTPITMIIIDILVEALKRFAEKVAKYDRSSLTHRIYHMMNIIHVVHILNEFFAWIKSTMEDNDDRSQTRDMPNYELLKPSLDRYQKQLLYASQLIDMTHPVSEFRLQLDLLLMQVIVAKSSMK